MSGSFWGNSGKRIGGRGVLESNFIINFHAFPIFLVLKAILKYVLHFINEYGELVIIDPGDQAESSLGASVEASGKGG